MYHHEDLHQVCVQLHMVYSIHKQGFEAFATFSNKDLNRKINLRPSRGCWLLSVTCDWSAGQQYGAVYVRMSCGMNIAQYFNSCHEVVLC